MIQMGVPLGGKFTVASNMLSLIKGWSERSVFSVEGAEIFVPVINAEPGDHPLPDLLLCSSNMVDENI